MSSPSNVDRRYMHFFVSHRFDEHGQVVKELNDRLRGDSTFQLDCLDSKSPQIQNPLESSRRRVEDCDFLLVILPNQLSDATYPYELSQSRGSQKLSIVEIEVELAMRHRKPILAFQVTCTPSHPNPSRSPNHSSTLRRLRNYTTIADLNSSGANEVAAAICGILQDNRRQETLRLHVDYSKESDRIFSDIAHFEEATYTPRDPLRRESTPSNITRFEDKLTQEGAGGVRFHFIVASSGVGKTTYINSFCKRRLREREMPSSSHHTSPGEDVGCGWFLNSPLVRINGAEKLGSKDTSFMERKLDLTDRLARFKGPNISSGVWRSQAPCLLIDGFNQWNLVYRTRIIDKLAEYARDWNAEGRAVNVVITTRPHTFKAIEPVFRNAVGVDPSALQFDLPDLLFDEERDSTVQEKMRRVAYDKYSAVRSYELPADSRSLPPEVFRLLLRVPVYFRLIGGMLKKSGSNIAAMHIVEMIVQQAIREVLVPWDAHEMRQSASPIPYLDDREELISEFFRHVAAFLVFSKRQTVTGAELSNIARATVGRCALPETQRETGTQAKELLRQVLSSEVFQDVSGVDSLLDRTIYRFRYDLVAEAHFACVLDVPIGEVLAQSKPNGRTHLGSEIVKKAMRSLAEKYRLDVEGGDKLWQMDELHTQGTSLGLAKAISRSVAPRADGEAATWLRHLFELTRPKDRHGALADDEYLFCVTLFKRAFVTAFVADDDFAIALSTVLYDCITEANPKTRVWAIQLCIDCLQNCSTYYGANASPARQASMRRVVNSLHSTLLVGDSQVSDQGCIAVATLIGDPIYVDPCIENVRVVIAQIRGRSLLNLTIQTVAAGWLGRKTVACLRPGYALDSMRKLILLLHEFLFSAAAQGSAVAGKVREELFTQLQSVVAEHAQRFAESPIRQAIALRLLDLVFGTMLRANQMPVNYRQWRIICRDTGASTQFRQSCAWVDPNGALDTNAVLASFRSAVPNAFLIQNLAFALSGRYFWSRRHSPDAPPDVLVTIDQLLEKAKALEDCGEMRRDALIAMRYAVSLGLYHANSFAEDMKPLREATTLNVNLAREMVVSRGTEYEDSDQRRVTTNIIGTTIRSMLHADESEQAFIHIDRFTQTLPRDVRWHDKHFELASILARDLALISVLERGNQRVINKLFGLGCSAWENHMQPQSIDVEKARTSGQSYEKLQENFRADFGDAFVRVAGFYPRAVDDCLADRTGLEASTSAREVVKYIHQARATAWSNRQVGFDTDLSSWLFERMVVNVSTRLVDSKSGRLVIPSLVGEFMEFLDDHEPLVPANALSVLGTLVIRRTVEALVATAPPSAS